MIVAGTVWPLLFCYCCMNSVTFSWKYLCYLNDAPHHVICVITHKHDVSILTVCVGDVTLLMWTTKQKIFWVTKSKKMYTFKGLRKLKDILILHKLTKKWNKSELNFHRITMFSFSSFRVCIQFEFEVKLFSLTNLRYRIRLMFIFIFSCV